jgi:AP-3 complex subunit beta
LQNSGKQIAKALVRILRNPREIQYVVLDAIKSMAQAQPSLFVSYLHDFFIKSSDPIFNRLLKLEIISSITTKQNIAIVLKELQLYVKHTNKAFVAAVVKTVGKVAEVDRENAPNCMEGLLYVLYCNKSDVTICDKVVHSLRLIIQQYMKANTGASKEKVCIRIIRSLAKLLLAEDGIESSNARACIVWLIGEVADQLIDVLPDILRILASGFVEESVETKTQIMNLAMKLSLMQVKSVNLLLLFCLFINIYGHYLYLFQTLE